MTESNQDRGAGAAALDGQAFHLIGVGGAGMSVVAQLLAERGATVTGSDAHDGPALEHLRDLGLGVYVGHDPARVPPRATVVVSSAIRASNPELLAARASGARVVHRSQALALAAQGRDLVAVAGAHGKTTTSSMLAQALRRLGQDPSFAVGGVVRDLGTGAHLGGGAVFVAEADESDRSFLNYSPRVEVITNVEPDHLDTYGTAEAFEAAFLDFAHCLVPGGLLVACADDPGSLRLALTAAEEGLRVATYGTTGVTSLPAGSLVESHVHLEVTGRHAQGTQAVLTRTVMSDGGLSTSVPVHLDLGAPGDHVALDAAGAWAAGLEVGADPEAMARALACFGGAGRRFEARGEGDGVRVVDDYAHHPTEIRALLEAARQVVAPGGRVLVLFQPHLFSRTQAFADRFAAALDQADEVIVTGVYPARENQSDFPQVTGAMITDRMRAGRYVADREQAAHAAAAAARPGDLLLTVGAGDVTELADVVLEDLRRRGDGAS